jgi:hypothetical protein
MLRHYDPGGRMYTSVGTSNANLLAWWTSLGTNAGSSWSVSAGNGRTTGSSLRCVSASASDQRLFKTLTAQATWGIAFGFRFSALTGVNGGQIAGTRDITTNQADLRLNSDGTLAVTRNGTALATSAVALSLNTYYHIEFKVTIGASAAYEVRLNGVAVIGPATGNTQATGNATANGIFIGPLSGSASAYGNMDFDDVVVYDGQATDANGFSDINTFIGDCGVAWLQPTGAGTTTQFTPGAGSNYAQVNEATPDGDTTYVESATVGQIDTYAMADLPVGVLAVKTLAVVHHGRKTDVGSRGMKAVVRSGGGNTAHATEIALANTYQYYGSVFGQNPNAGSAINWTPTSVNALEIGQTVSS